MVGVGSAAAGRAGLGDQCRGDAQLVVEAVATHQVLAVDDDGRGARHLGALGERAGGIDLLLHGIAPQRLQMFCIGSAPSWCSALNTAAWLRLATPTSSAA
ncbi:hypothetical protein G6F35_018198 [Rhizopus arrhizus]|nr:hypothetical protein G6F35_018198 [Rhizopus arrhizus]